MNSEHKKVNDEQRAGSSKKPHRNLMAWHGSLPASCLSRTGTILIFLSSSRGERGFRRRVQTYGTVAANLRKLRKLSLIVVHAFSQTALGKSGSPIGVQLVLMVSAHENF